MLKFLGILWNSFRMALQELKVNKLRTFLSLIGITIGIFCIIGVLATIDSLQAKVRSDLQSFGTNTVYIDKWEYAGGPDYPWWRFVNRPIPKYQEVKLVKERSSLAESVSYFNSVTVTLIHDNDQLENVSVYGISEDYNKIQTIDIEVGRYLSETEFTRGNSVCVIGDDNAVQFFGSAANAIGKEVTFAGRKVTIVGVIAKQGATMVGGFDYDHCLIISYRFFASIYDVNGWSTNPSIMVKGYDNIPSAALVDELRGIMRQIRKLSPTQEDNFALNDINTLTEQTDSIFSALNLGGVAIAGLSLLVGAFGVANIMFVTVRERTSQIGLKKAIGAKSRTILSEFLMESAFLCILGGFIGLLLVWALTKVISGVMPFPINISVGIIGVALGICISLGILAGIIPAFIAARMNPVEAIRK